MSPSVRAPERVVLFAFRAELAFRSIDSDLKLRSETTAVFFVFVNVQVGLSDREAGGRFRANYVLALLSMRVRRAKHCA